MNRIMPTRWMLTLAALLPFLTPPSARGVEDVVRSFGAGDFPGADTYYSGCLSLPMFPAMRDEDVDAVVTAVGALLG